MGGYHRVVVSHIYYSPSPTESSTQWGLFIVPNAPRGALDSTQHASDNLALSVSILVS